MKRFIKKDLKDNVATALIDLKRSEIANVYSSKEEHLDDVPSIKTKIIYLDPPIHP